VQGWRKRKRKGRGFPWYTLLLLGICVGGLLTACGDEDWKEVGGSICTEIPEGFEPFPPDPGTCHLVKILNYSGPDVGADQKLADSYAYIFTWMVNYEVERAPGTGNAGWIIQQIDYRLEREGRSGIVPPVRDVYWESWPVDAGAVEPLPNPRHPDWDDGFSASPSGLNGREETRGIVKFCEYEGDLPGFHSPPPNHPAGGLHISESPPSFWDFSGTCHDWTIEWTGLKKPDNKPCWSYEARMGNLGKSDSWCGSW
jgi:hypothetical protein